MWCFKDKVCGNVDKVSLLTKARIAHELKPAEAQRKITTAFRAKFDQEAELKFLENNGTDVVVFEVDGLKFETMPNSSLFNECFYLINPFSKNDGRVVYNLADIYETYSSFKDKR